MKRLSSTTALALLLSLVVSLGAGCRGRGDADVLLTLVDPVSLQGLDGVRARLTLTDDNDEHPSVAVVDADGDATFVLAVDVPIPCTANGCNASLQVDPGRYDVELVLSAEDRCAQASDVLRLDGAFEVGFWESTVAELAVASANFDADNDGVIDILEASLCGRFDLDEGNQPPRGDCAPGHEACCQDASPAIGGQMAFPTTSDHPLPYERAAVGANDVVDVPAFALDSTELTFGQLARCVAAGACLENQSEHPARLLLASGIDPRLPARGLRPIDGAEVCAFYGKRLPTDAEWDVAAADRDGDRARFPFDVEAGVAVGCLPTDPPPAARYRASGRDCAGSDTLPVGSYPTTAITRGAGTAIMDMAGNVAEWTILCDAVDAVDADGDGLPDGAAGVVLRGGSATSFLELMENSVTLIFDADDVSDVARIQTASVAAGVRCAVDAVDAVDLEPAPAPSCPGN